MSLSQIEGHELLNFAKNCVYSELFLKKLIVPDSIKKYDKKQGIFVTIKKNGELRGCIGFIIGHYPLYEGIINASHAAAFEDYRFSPITKTEWESLEFEISVLTVPEEIKSAPQDLPKNIIIGVDGLICESGSYSGLLLPQVAPEWNWNEEQFLSHTCQKAGLAMNAWKTGKCKFKKFQAQVFEEKIQINNKA
jgi:uncharacterized protein